MNQFRPNESIIFADKQSTVRLLLSKTDCGWVVNVKRVMCCTTNEVEVVYCSHLKFWCEIPPIRPMVLRTTAMEQQQQHNMHLHNILVVALRDACVVCSAVLRNNCNLHVVTHVQKCYGNNIAKMDVKCSFPNIFMCTREHICAGSNTTCLSSRSPGIWNAMQCLLPYDRFRFEWILCSLHSTHTHGHAKALIRNPF